MRQADDFIYILYKCFKEPHVEAAGGEVAEEAKKKIMAHRLLLESPEPPGLEDAGTWGNE